MKLPDKEVFVVAAVDPTNYGGLEILAVFEDDAEADILCDVIDKTGPSKNVSVFTSYYWGVTE